MLDSLNYVKRLEEVGVAREHAEVQVQIMTELTQTHFASKQDIIDVRRDIQDVRKGIEDVRKEMQNEFRVVRSDMAQLESRLTIKLGVMMGAMISLGAALTTVLAKLL